jgi:hypothetical protein
MDNFKFILNYIISTPGFFNTNIAEILGLLVNFILTLITAVSVIIALWNSNRIIQRDIEIEKNKNNKTVNVINQLTSFQRGCFSSFSSEFNFITIKTRDCKDIIRSFEDGFYKLIVDSEQKCLFLGVDLLLKKEVENTVEEHKQQLKEILVQYHINLDISSANEIANRIDILERIILTIEDLDTNELYSDSTIIQNTDKMTSKYGQLKILETYLEMASKKLPTN